MATITNEGQGLGDRLEDNELAENQQRPNIEEEMKPDKSLHIVIPLQQSELSTAKYWKDRETITAELVDLLASGRL